MERVDARMMTAAVAAAGSHRTHPNPRVGAVVVVEDRIVGRGGHAGPGHPHAEAVALAAAGSRARGATLYVTLEPCAHAGRTGPCTDAIVAAGVARVVAAVEDPDPQVAGRGLAALRRADIEVTTGVGAEEAVGLDPGYFHHRLTGRPRVTLKVAMTLDGQIAGRDGSSRWITSQEARRDSHLLRSQHDAVMIGAGTLLADDPALTVRLDDYRGPQPVPVVVAGKRSIPADARVFARPTLVFAPAGLDLPAEVVVVPDAGGEQVDPAKMLEMLGSRGIVDLMVEGGGTLVRCLIDHGRIDRGVIYVAAALAGGRGRTVFGGFFESIDDLHRVRLTEVRRLGPDIRIDFDMEGA